MCLNCVRHPQGPCSATAAFLVAALPPVDCLAALLNLFERPGDEAGVATAGHFGAELPKLARRLLVAVDQFVQLEGVQLAGVVAVETVPHLLQKVSEPHLVIVGDERHVGQALCLGGLGGVGAHADSTVSQASPSAALRFEEISCLGDTIPDVAVSPTKTVEFDSELLERLHARRPEMSDRELLESMARMTLGRETLRRVQERNTLSEDEAIELGVKAVHEARRERRAAG